MPKPAEGNFPDTSLTLYQRLQSKSAVESTAALEEFFTRYWYPLYVFLRSAGENHHDASDYVQGFISGELLNRNQLRNWTPSKGTLRGFLKTCLDRYRKKEIRKQTAQKRGGNRESTHVSISMNLDWAEKHFDETSSRGESPDRQYELEWAATIVNQTTSNLAKTYAAKDKQIEFQLLLQNLNERDDLEKSATYSRIAAELGIDENAVKQKMRTFRSRFQKELSNVVGETVDPDEIDEEIDFLMQLFGN